MEIEAAGQPCSDCGTRFSQNALACPGCQKLVHAEALKDLAANARAAAARGESREELRVWRSALALLPAESRQYAQIGERVAALSRAVEDGAGSGNKTAKRAAGLGVLAAFLLKFKSVALLLLTKAKFLMLGLTKLPTLLSMLATMGLYFTIFGWKFAVGLVLSIYLHEMGHVAAMTRLGIAASAPMFIPGVGAFVRGGQYPTTPSEAARIGLAGPIWGLGTGLACAAMYLVTRAQIWGALAHMGAYLNLFNLIPVFGLDGDHGFRALTKNQRLIACVAIFAAFVATKEMLLLLILAVALMRAFGQNVASAPDVRSLIEYVVLILALAWLARPQLLFVPT